MIVPIGNALVAKTRTLIRVVDQKLVCFNGLKKKKEENKLLEIVMGLHKNQISKSFFFRM